jgi:hypothetical protein
MTQQVCYQLGNVLLGGMLYDTNSYCLQESIQNETFNWDLRVCKTNFYLQRILHLFCKSSCNQVQQKSCNVVSVYILSLLFLSATIFSYVYVHELRSTVSGKCFVCFATSILVVYIVLSLVVYHVVDYNVSVIVLIAGFIVSFLWHSLR